MKVEGNVCGPRSPYLEPRGQDAHDLRPDAQPYESRHAAVGDRRCEEHIDLPLLVVHLLVSRSRKKKERIGGSERPTVVAETQKELVPLLSPVRVSWPHTPAAYREEKVGEACGCVVGEAHLDVAVRHNAELLERVRVLRVRDVTNVLEDFDRVDGFPLSEGLAGPLLLLSAALVRAARRRQTRPLAPRHHLPLPHHRVHVVERRRHRPFTV